MATATKFEELEIFQTARTPTRLIYTITNEGAFSKDYGLRDQMRRAAVSIMSNIAEGFESRTNALFIEFLGRAKGSVRRVSRSMLCRVGHWVHRPESVSRPGQSRREMQPADKQPHGVSKGAQIDDKERLKLQPSTCNLQLSTCLKEHRSTTRNS
jgi:hypothetical protein